MKRAVLNGSDDIDEKDGERTNRNGTHEWLFDE